MKPLHVACTATAPELLPRYHSPGSSGADLRADLPAGQELLIEPGRRALVPTGIRLQIPEGFEAQVRSRSGLAAKAGVAALNSPGTIDSDYRGEIRVILINLGERPFRVVRGDRIAQLVFVPVMQASFQPHDRLEDTSRGEGGFGSTGRS